MSSATLTSLAMLKVNVDHGRDYLDYLQPFVLQILVDHKPDPVTSVVVSEQIRVLFGLEIPERAIQLVLKRLARRISMKKDAGVYRITGALPDPRLATKKASAERHINVIVNGLVEFSQHSTRPVSDEQAVTALLAFLSQFEVPFLRAYLRGTAIPTITGDHHTDIVMVSQYVMHLQRTDAKRLESFMVLVQGHMLANALMCPDLSEAPKSYRDVEFYLDTPLLIRRLGLEGTHRKDAMESLIDLVRRLGASVATFAHTQRELERVIRWAADNLENNGGRSAIVMEARRNGTTKSDLLMIAGQIDELLSVARVDVKPTPPYEKSFQIDEARFEEALKDEISYANPRARQDDINSVRSIYVLRSGVTPTTLEKSKAVLVTSNTGFAAAAMEYGKQFEESCDVSSVITDFSLANMAWLKAPMGAPSLPKTEILAFSYAALQPSTEWLNKYLAEIDRLERKGAITARDHQLARSTMLVQDELMSLTLGDEDALTEETVTEILRRVTDQLKWEETEKLSAEQTAHQLTQARLDHEEQKRRRIREQLYWRCQRWAKHQSWVIAGLIAFLFLVGVAAGLGLKSTNPILGWILLVGGGLVTFAAIVDMLVGFSVREMRERLETSLFSWRFKREAIALGIDLEDTV